MMERLSAVLEPIESGVSVNAEDRPAINGEVGVLKVSCVADGRFYPSENKAVTDPTEKARLSSHVRAGDILISRANTPQLVGACGMASVTREDLFLSDKIWRTAVRDPLRDDSRWILAVLNSPMVRSRLRARASGTSGSMKNISQKSLWTVEVPRPPLKDQKRFADVVAALTTTSDRLSTLISKKRLFKRGLMQRLLRGRIQAQSSLDCWPSIQLRAVTREVRKRNARVLDESFVMGVSKFDGVVPMRERTIGADLNRYKTLPPGAFAYNPMRLNIGSIARWSGTDDVLVSPDYVVFEALPEALDGRYLDQYRRSHAWKRFMEAAGNGGVRVRIYYDELAALKLPMPPLEDQRRIADILDLLDREISLLQRQRDLLEKQKRAVMHKLLTGEVRLAATE